MDGCVLLDLLLLGRLAALAGAPLDHPLLLLEIALFVLVLKFDRLGELGGVLKTWIGHTIGLHRCNR